MRKENILKSGLFTCSLVNIRTMLLKMNQHYMKFSKYLVFYVLLHIQGKSRQGKVFTCWK